MVTMKKGVFCLSLDTELLWGRHDLPHEQFIPRVTQERNIIKKVLSLTKKYKFPVTWAIVGHLFLDKCSVILNTKHPEIKRPRYSWVKDDWFTSDPCTNIRQNPQWYGLDIVKSIKAIGFHEIASHSFSHMIFDVPGCSKTSAESEIKACVYLAKQYGIKLTSFVFPRNGVGHLAILKHYGFLAYRGVQPQIYTVIPFLNTIIQAVDLFLPTSPPVSKPLRVSGLVNIPASLYFVSARGIRKYIPRNVRFFKVKRGIDRAIKEKKIFHLWTHPTDFVDRTDMLMKDFEHILEYASQKQVEGVLDVKTMAEIAKKGSINE